jgi:hypothetical protein
LQLALLVYWDGCLIMRRMGPKELFIGIFFLMALWDYGNVVVFRLIWDFYLIPLLVYQLSIFNTLF